MSWLARSLANTLRLDADADDEEFKHSYRNDVVDRPAAANSASSTAVDEENSAYEEIDLLEDRSNYTNYDDFISDDTINHNRGGGVKDDLSELKETLTRQLWGAASFLAPPPPPPPPPLPPRQSDLFGSDRDRDQSSLGFVPEEEEEEEEEEAEYVGNRGCYIEDSDYQDDDEVVEDSVDGAAFGVTEEVLAFATNIAHHPETWLDFPLADDEEEFDDFELSDAQQKHAYAVERLTPRLAALRIELCPAHMTEGYFWMVYFVLLYSRLNKHDAELLSTPQLVEARAMWIQELQKKTKPESDWFGIDAFRARESTYSTHGDFESNSSEDAHSRYVLNQRAFAFEPPCNSTSDTEIEKHPIENKEIQYNDKAVIEEDPPSQVIDKEVTASKSLKPPVFDYDEHEDDWLKDNSELEGYSGTAILNVDDVSFSDLEDDIDCVVPTKPKSVSTDYNG